MAENEIDVEYLNLTDKLSSLQQALGLLSKSDRFFLFSVSDNGDHRCIIHSDEGKEIEVSIESMTLLNALYEELKK